MKIEVVTNTCLSADSSAIASASAEAFAKAEAAREPVSCFIGFLENPRIDVKLVNSEEIFHKWSGACWHRSSFAMRHNCHGRSCASVGCFQGSRGRLACAAALLLCLFSFLPDFSAFAMDRFAALSMIESGNDDSAIGPGGEISRYQILPDAWQYYSKGRVLDPLNASNSLSIARAMMSERCARFQETNHHPPTDFEFYLLWNCPARVAHPSKLATDRAQRFANLCGAHEPRNSGKIPK